MRRRNLSCSKVQIKDRSVAEDCNKYCLEAQTEVTDVVNHTLLSKGEVSSLANNKVSPLDTDDGD